MNINYDKVSEEEVPMYKLAMDKALAYMKYKYPELCYCGLKINLSSYGGGSNFTPSNKDGWKIKISNRHILYFYDRKNCGLTTPKNGIEVPVEVDSVITIIHELTHYAQGVLGSRIYSEIDTTKNSIEYLQMYHPDIHSKLVKSEGKVYRRGYLVKNKTKRVKQPLKTNLEKLYEEINKNKIIEVKIIDMPKEIEKDVNEVKQVASKGKTKIKEPLNTNPTNKDKEKLEKLLSKKKIWETKLKRAENAVKKLNKKIKYYQKKQK
ncbi:MAG: hypothetical protein IPJ01_10345 [Micavibrio sp.]|nr:hypothetical protein [Micavibrio sp.]